jgi:hypothetical protein
MSKKDYERAATIVRATKRFDATETRRIVIDAFIELFRDDNPRFNVNQFRKACDA